MMKQFGILLAISTSLILGGCFWGEKVEVPQAHYGKVLTKNGFNPGVIVPSRFRLAKCWFYCDKLMVVEAGDKQFKEEFRDNKGLFMPKSELRMPFDIRGTYSIDNNEKQLDNLFSRLPTTKSENWNYSGIIEQDRIYEIYAKPVIRDVVRQQLAEFTIEEVASSRGAVNKKLWDAVANALKDTPIRIVRLGLGDVQFPEVIIAKKQAAAEAKIAIDQEEAKKQVALVALQTELEKAKAQRAIRREKAEAIKEENAIYAESVTDKYLSYRRLEVLEELAKSQGTKWVPFEALGSVGLNNKVFNQ